MCLRTAKPLQNGGTGYVIGGGEQPITESMFDRTWERIGKTINLHGATHHVLRHSYAVFALEAGDNMKEIQAALGHYSAAFTMNTYAHVSDQARRESAKRQEEKMKRMLI